VEESIFFQISLIVIVSGILSLAALFLRQPIIIAYLAGGLLIGASGFGWIHDTALLDNISLIGINLLLFLAGIVLHPRRLKELFRQTLLLTLTNSVVSLLVCTLFCRIWGFDWASAIFIALPLIFSSTILVLKLIPTTALHHKRMGAYSIAILIAQDLIAIAMLIFMGAGHQADKWAWISLPLKGIALITITFLGEQYVLRRLMGWSEQFGEVLNLLALGWCLGISIAAETLGLSHAIGAFIAGVALARSPMAYFLSEGLKPFRDFFLIFFFFMLGSHINPAVAKDLFLPAICLTLIMMAVKYASFRTLFRAIGETKPFAHETGLRLAQASEFSLIVAMVAHTEGWLEDSAFQMVELVTIFSLIFSSYIVVNKLPSPLATNPKLKQD
jgi:Kef-type K+ transport system membrane component KefB